MDPDAVLEDLRSAIHELKIEIAKGFDGDLGDAADKAIVKFEALDLWLQGGGFLPRPWRDSRRG